MQLTLTITVDLTKSTGKFVSKDELAEALMEELPDPGVVYVDESEYEVADWQVEWT